MRDLFESMLVLLCLLVVLTITGCDEAKFKREHPVADEMIEGAETVGGAGADVVLKLPAGTTKAIIDRVEEMVDTPELPKDEPKQN